jgi:hypothetical protein
LLGIRAILFFFVKVRCNHHLGSIFSMMLIWICRLITKFLSIYLNIYLHIYLSIYLSIYLYIYLYIYLSIYLPIYYLYILRSMHFCMYVCIYVCMPECIYVRMYACLHLCMYVVCLYACMHACLYLCMYVCCLYVCDFYFIQLSSGSFALMQTCVLVAMSSQSIFFWIFCLRFSILSRTLASGYNVILVETVGVGQSEVYLSYIEFIFLRLCFFVDLIVF